MRNAAFGIMAVLILAQSGIASAQAIYPGQPYISAPRDPQSYRMEVQRQNSADQAAFAQRYQLDARLTQFEIQAQRRPEPFVALVETAPSTPEAERQARERATAQRQSTVSGVTQIDDWLARTPR